jgi:hypothetical protein
MILDWDFLKRPHADTKNLVPGYARAPRHTSHVYVDISQLLYSRTHSIMDSNQQ